MNAVKDHKYVKKIHKEEMTCSFGIDDTEEPDPSEHQKKKSGTKHTTKAKHKNVASALLAQSLKQISSQEIATKEKKTDSQQGTLSKRILTKVPPILSKKHANKTSAKSETAPLHMSSENVNQIRETASKSKSLKTETVSTVALSESMFQLQTSTASSSVVTPIIISSTEATIIQNSGLCKSGTAQTLTTPTFVGPVSSSRVSHGKMEKSGNQVQTKVDGQVDAPPNVNLMLVGTPNRYCLIQQPTDTNTVQLVANQLPVPQTNLLLTSNPLLAGVTTNSSMTQSGIVLMTPSQASLHTPYTCTTTSTALKRILPAAPPATQNKNPDTSHTTQIGTASQMETPVVSSHAELSLPISTPSTTLPKVFILAAPNSMSSMLKANRTGFIVPVSTTPNSTMTGITSKAPCIDTVTSPDDHKTEENPASQLLLSFIKKELQTPAIEDKKSNITDDKVSNSKEEVRDKNLPESGNTEKLLVPPKQDEKSKSETKDSLVKIGSKEEVRGEYSPKFGKTEKLLVPPKQNERSQSEMKGSLMKIGSALYHFVVKDGQQYLVPISQQLLSGQAMIPASTLPQRTELSKATKLSSWKKRKHEDRKVNFDHGKYFT